MSKGLVRQVTKRFLEVLDELIRNRVADNMKTICLTLGYQQQNLSQMREGKREVTLLLIVKVYEEFGGSPMYILFNEGEKILADRKLNLEGNKTAMDDSQTTLVKKLEDLVESKNDYIALLKKEVERLTKELYSKQK